MTTAPTITILSEPEADAFVAEWMEAWNSHDLDRILEHYADDVEYHSPFIAQVAEPGGPGADGRLVGKEPVRAYFAAALEYIELLPRSELRLRSFCAIPLFMATATARVCRNNPDVFLADEPVKIPRSEAKRIVLRSKMFGWWNGYLRKWYRQDIELLASAS